MTTASRKTAGIILLTVPSIIYGGYFLLSILSGQQEALGLTEFQKSMFRAGHAHAGVLVILALVVQLLVDHAHFPDGVKWFTRISFPTAAILVSMGFFAAAMGEGITKPTDLIVILYLGATVLALALILLGVGLVRKQD